MWPWRILVDLQLVGLSDNKSGQISLVQFWLQSCSVPPGRLQGAAARPSCCCSSGVLFGVQQLLLCDSLWQRSMWCDSCCNADARRKFRPCPPLPGCCDWELQLKNFQPEPRRRLERLKLWQLPGQIISGLWSNWQPYLEQTVAPPRDTWDGEISFIPRVNYSTFGHLEAVYTPIQTGCCGVAEDKSDLQPDVSIKPLKTPNLNLAIHTHPPAATNMASSDMCGIIHRCSWLMHCFFDIFRVVIVNIQGWGKSSEGILNHEQWCC